MWGGGGDDYTYQNDRVEWSAKGQQQKIVVGSPADFALKLLMLKDVWHCTARDPMLAE